MNNQIVSIYKKNNGNLCIKHTSELASINDLNNYIIKTNEKDITPIHEKYSLIRLKEGIYKKYEDNVVIIYKRIRELNNLDFEEIKKEAD